jgi:ribosome biogenesis GTPase A
MNYQWYPGHMTKARRMMEENIKLIDLVIELVDARIPMSSRNPDIDNLAKNKSRIILLNKSDLADERKTLEWIEYFTAKGFYVLKLNSKNGAGIKQINGLILQACKEKIERDQRKGIMNRPIRAMVVGIPNVGKSTFINAFAGKACAKTGNKPGVTKGKQWIRLNKNVELLDTPGILWPKFDNQEVGKRLALIGSMNDEVLDVSELALDALKFMMVEYPKQLEERYGISLTFDEDKASEGISEETSKALYIMEQIALKRGCLKRKAEPDYEKAGRLIMEDFRSGHVGRFTLEKPEEQ